MTDKEEIKDGVVEEFHDNGQLKSREKYKDEKKEGLQEDFHKNGKLKFKGNYKDGKKDGLVETFYAKGPLKLRENYKNGKKEGLQEDFYRDGSWTRKNYKNGKIDGLYETYYPNGQLMTRVNYKNGKTDGISEQFYDDGRPDEEEKRMWDVFDYIENNVKDILIPDLEVISHIKPSKTEHGFINFLWKYPVFPKRNKEEIQFSKEALYWYKDFHELWLEDSRYVGDYTSPLGGIRFKDQKKWRYRKSLGSVHALWKSPYFENVYSFFDESIYRFDGWFDDFDYDFTDEGIDFEWSYPPYFTIFDEGLKQFSQRLWEYFLERRVEMTVKKEWQIVMQGHAAANSIPVISSNRTGIETNEGSATKTKAYEEGVGLYSLSKQAVENHLSGITEIIRRLKLRIDEIKAKPERELKEKFEKEQKEKGKERRKRIDTQAEEFKSNQEEHLIFDSKEMEKLASYESPKDQVKKKIKEQEEKREQQEQEEWDNEEKRMWDVFDYIENNVKDILIPDLEVISHIKPSKTEHGFINFLWKYPVFPKRNKEEIQFSKEALYWYKDFHELWLGESCYVGDYTSPLGGIRFKDQKKWRYRKSLRDVFELVESPYFENVYSFFDESIYRFDGWFDDFDYDFTDEGIDFEWSYPPYFTIFDEGLKQFSQRLWEYFLERRVEMTVKKEGSATKTETYEKSELIE